MGIIRKSLAVSSAGMVSWESKKQRNQRAIIKQQRIGNQLAAAQLAAQQAQAQAAVLHAELARREVEILQQAALHQRREQREAQGQAAIAAPQGQHPPRRNMFGTGWFADPWAARRQRFWEGNAWTHHTRSSS